MKIAVHNGKFHADDCLAVYFLHNTNEFKDAEVVRTRDQTVIDQCDVVCDVGGVYDHEKRRYDHHQLGFNITYPGKNIILSSCGLVFMHYGKEIITNILKKKNMTIPESTFPMVIDMLYERYVKEIDAIDNGVSMVPGEEPTYKISTDISSRIDYMNVSKAECTEEFLQASEVIGKEFEFLLSYIIQYFVPDFIAVKEAYEKRFEIDPRGFVLVLDQFHEANKIIPYIEKEGDNLLFYITTKPPNGWRVYTFTVKGSYQPRLKLPFPGYSGEEMSKASGIPGGIFSHKSAFLAVFEEKEQAIQYARYSYDLAQKQKQE